MENLSTMSQNSELVIDQIDKCKHIFKNLFYGGSEKLHKQNQSDVLEENISSFFHKQKYNL